MSTTEERTSYPSAMQRGATAHGGNGKRNGGGANWPAWYAAPMVAEQAGTQAGTELPA